MGGEGTKIKLIDILEARKKGVLCFSELIMCVGVGCAHGRLCEQPGLPRGIHMPKPLSPPVRYIWELLCSIYINSFFFLDMYRYYS